MVDPNTPQVTPSIPFEVDGEVVYLSPNSAEGKALQRIEAMEAGEEVEWITHKDSGEPLDVTAANQWLKESDFDAQISFPDTSKAGH